MHLSRDALKQLILDKQLVTGYVDLDGQLTANGIDVRLAAVIEIIEGGKLAVDKKNNKPPKLGRACVLKGYEDRLLEYKIGNIQIVEHGSVMLEAGKPYFVITCEQVNTPDDHMFHIHARTSLFRFTQSTLLCTVGEAGYRGFLTFVLVPFLKSEIELGMRFAQFTFTELKGKAQYDAQKQANYQGGKLF